MFASYDFRRKAHSLIIHVGDTEGHQPVDQAVRGTNIRPKRAGRVSGRFCMFSEV